MTAQQELAFLLSKIRLRLRHWTNCWLPMPSKVILIKHVLSAMPAFFFMLLDLLQEGSRKETICRTFLWGFDEEQNLKVPIVAWGNLAE
jgi:hypothetical protein